MTNDKVYCTKKWISHPLSPSTGSITCFKGDVTWRGKTAITSFIEIADCNEKVRLHQSEDETDREYYNKLVALKMDLEDYIDYLEEELQNE